MAGLAFNDTSGGQGLIQECESLTNLGSGTISGNTSLLKDFTRYINIWYHRVATMIFQSQDDWNWDDLNNTSNYPIATTPLVAGQRDYVFPTTLNMLKIRRVDVTYDGTNWNRVYPFDSQSMEFGLGNDTTVDGRFDKSVPYYDVRSNAVFLYPTASAADVTAGATLRVEYSRDITEFTTSSTTTTPGFDPAFHRLLAVGAARDWAISKNLPKAAQLQAEAADLEARLKEHYGSKDVDIVPVFKLALINYK